MNDLNCSFRALHDSGCFIVPNPWDTTSARLLAKCGFQALASTSSGYAFATGRSDGRRQVPRSEAIVYAVSLMNATGLPVTFDAEDCFEDSPEGVARTVALAADAGLSGISIEDRDTAKPGRIRDFSESLERVQAAVEQAKRSGIVLTARADGFGKGAYDFKETLQRLSAYAEAGADVVYAPGLLDIKMIKTVCESVSVPVNHVLGQGAKGLGVGDLANAGVRRVSLGGSLLRASLEAFTRVARSIATGDFEAIDTAPAWNDLV
jgi:2-methylisocitrate lyase-like PEP mutase family enzyme